jgi:hypothetical protein
MDCTGRFFCCVLTHTFLQEKAAAGRMVMGILVRCGSSSNSNFTVPGYIHHISSASTQSCNPIEYLFSNCWMLLVRNLVTQFRIFSVTG